MDPPRGQNASGATSLGSAIEPDELRLRNCHPMSRPSPCVGCATADEERDTIATTREKISQLTAACKEIPLYPFRHTDGSWPFQSAFPSMATPPRGARELSSPRKRSDVRSARQPRASMPGERATAVAMRATRTSIPGALVPWPSLAASEPAHQSRGPRAVSSCRKGLGDARHPICNHP